MKDLGGLEERGIRGSNQMINTLSLQIKQKLHIKKATKIEYLVTLNLNVIDLHHIVLISMTKRYFTSEFNTRSYASLI